MHSLLERGSFGASVVLALLLTLVLIACGETGSGTSSPDGPSPTPAPPTITPIPSPTPLPRGGNLTIRLTEDIPLLRPWHPRSRSEEQVISLLYRGMMRLDEQLRPVPDIATDWSAAPDGRTLTFTLRTDVTWHDGQALTSSDVQFTLDQLRAMTGTALLVNFQETIDEIFVPTPDTVVFSLTQSYAPLLSEFTVPILPRHLLDGDKLENVNFWEKSVGSGPFRFTSRVPGESIVLSRYDDYYGGAPLLDRVVFVGAADPNLTLEALMDERLLLAELPWNTTEAITTTPPNLRIDSYPENGFYFLGFNLREGRPFADLATRQALAHAIDMSRLVEAVTNGQGITITNSASPVSWANLVGSAIDTPDLQVARVLLEESGWSLPPGATIRHKGEQPLVAQLFVRGDDPRRLAAAQRIAEVAATIGIQIDIQPVDFASVLLSKYAPPNDFDLLLASWLNGAADPNFGDYLYYDPDDTAIFHSSQINKGVNDTRITRNFVGFIDSTYDKAAIRGLQSYELDERIAAYTESQQRVAELLPYLYLWVDRIPVALNQRVATLDGPVDLTTPVYLWNIERWYLQPE